MLEMLPLLLGVLASSFSVFVVTADRASAAWFAFVGHLAQMIAAATSLARAAAHKFVSFKWRGCLVSDPGKCRMAVGRLCCMGMFWDFGDWSCDCSHQ